MDLRDPSKLEIRNGIIYYSLYQQDGSMIEMTARDTKNMRLFVAWVQMHDRYTIHE